LDKNFFMKFFFFLINLFFFFLIVYKYKYLDFEFFYNIILFAKIFFFLLLGFFIKFWVFFFSVGFIIIFFNFFFPSTVFFNFFFRDLTDVIWYRWRWYNFLKRFRKIRRRKRLIGNWVQEHERLKKIRIGKRNKRKFIIDRSAKIKFPADKRSRFFKEKRRLRRRTFSLRSRYGFSMTNFSHFYGAILFWDNNFLKLTPQLNYLPFFYRSHLSIFRYNKLWHPNWFPDRDLSFMVEIFKKMHVIKKNNFWPKSLSCFVTMNKHSHVIKEIEAFHLKFIAKPRKKLGRMIYQALVKKGDHKRATFVRLRLNSEQPVNEFPLIP